jgi:hypothetical protein
MLTKKQVLSNHPGYRSLINAVLSSIEIEECEDIVNHGIDCGYSGFIYYADTAKFFKRHKKQIMKLLTNDAEEFGHSSIPNMIKAFSSMKLFTEDEIARAIYSGRGEYDHMVFDVCAKYAAETVCMWIVEEC